MHIRLTKTALVVARCWRDAETVLSAEVADSHPGLDEEGITLIFHGLFKKALSAANDRREIEDAFVKDIEHGTLGYGISEDAIRAFAHGLVADVTLHSRTTEGRKPATGGDLGVVLISPAVRYSSAKQWFAATPHKQGLLVQAKLGDAEGNWGPLSTKQVQVLPKRLDFTALLLYQYSDADRRNLKAYRWQLCEKQTIEQVSEWINEGKFPSLKSSEEIIRLLGSDSIGTNDAHIIDTVISPPQNQSLHITLDWPDGKPPKGNVHTYSHTQERVVVKVSL